ncbi:MAG: hypothetical protein WDN26_20455 [Chitinophagaceae bacterium]
MKKIMLVMIATVMIAAVTVAQENKDYKKDRTEWEKKIKEELKLNNDQAIKYDAISKEYNDKIEAVTQDAGLNKDVQKERKMALKKEKEIKLFEFFTPEQQVKYREIMEKKKKEMSNKPAS